MLSLCICPASVRAQPPLLAPATTAAADETQPAAATTPAEPGLEQKRQEVAKQLRLAQKALEAAETAANDPNAKPPEKLTREMELLKQLDLVLAQQRAAEELGRELESTQAELQGKIESARLSDIGEQGVSSFLVLDELRDEVAGEIARRDSFSIAVTTATEALARAKASHADRERARLQAKEAADTNKDETVAAKLAAALTQAEKDTNLAAEVMRLRERELANHKVAQELHELRITYLQEQVAQAGKSVVFTQADLEERLADLQIEETDLNLKTTLAERDYASLNSRWWDKRHDLELSSGDQPALVEEVESLHFAKQTRQQEIEILHKRLERLAKLRTAWTRRYDVMNGLVKSQELSQWITETQQYLAQLNGEERQLTNRVNDLRNKLSAVERKQQNLKSASRDVLAEVDLQRDHLQELSRIYDLNFVSIQDTRQLHEKLLHEFREDAETISLNELAARGWRHVSNVWHYPIAAVDERPITVGKITTGLVLLVMGYLISRSLSQFIGGRFLPRLGMHTSASAALQSIAFYLLVAMFTLLALRMVRVPLTVFTVLGGALAIGVGFGSQNIVNNFISGLILLAERPVRVGDLIELNGLYGTVTQIGARSTRITTATNMEIIVPNSSFLENNVINWTLSDDKIRATVAVGVAYGSPTRDVSRLLKRAAEEHGLVLSNPEPFVWFSDFADNSLNFELHFWIQMRSLGERRRIESDIRHVVDSLFREGGITIAFPQRDVHLDISQPISVRMASPEEYEGEMSKLHAA